MSKKTQILLIILAGLLFYYNSLHNGFVWDDEFLVQNNVHIRSLGSAASFGFSHEIFSGYALHNKSNYYRPLQLISYAIDYFLWQSIPFGFHLTSIFIHIANALLVYFVLLSLGSVWLVAFISSILFAVHPINTSAVSYISGRADILAGFFFLSSFYLFIRARNKNSKLALYFSLILCFFAFLSKEYALVTPLLFLVYDLCFNKLKKQYAYSYLLFLVTIISYFILRMHALGFNNSTGFSSLLIRDFPLRLLTFIKSIAIYLQLLILPLNLHMERVFVKPTSFFDPLIFITTLCLLVVWVLLYRKKEKQPQFFFFFLFFLILIFSQSYILLVNITFSEHFLYLAAISFFFVFAYFFNRFFIFWKGNPEKQKLLSIALACVVIFFGSLTSIYNLNWKDNISLFRWTLKNFENSARVHLNLGNEYFALGNYELALNHYYKGRYLLSRISLERYPNKGVLEKELDRIILVAHYNLGVNYSAKGDYSRAGNNYLAALSIDKNFHLARNNFAALLSKLNRQSEAIEQINIVLSLDPKNVKAYYNLGVIYANIGEFNKAERIWLKGLSFEPANQDLRSCLVRLKEIERKKNGDK